ncbi:MAG TPA: DUF2461 domain-containing protein [Acidobacteriaceae bacterium]|nr:DUF2461 domain-containing protein [Acidobacteriaceae bacterium]
MERRVPATKKAPAKGTQAAQAYFTPEGLRFLRGLARNNDRDWFNERKPVYEAEIKRPMLAVIEAVTGAMMDFAPGHVRAPESIMMRIYRDTRFSKSKLPYKTHVAAWWVHDGLRKTSGAGFYLHVSAKQVEIAAGAFMPETEQLLAIRRFLMEHHKEYRKLTQARGFRRLFTEDEGREGLSRSPKGFPAEHPAAELYRQKRWGFGVSLAAEMATQPEFSKTVAQHFRAAAPLVALLNRPLMVKAERPRRPLF